MKEEEKVNRWSRADPEGPESQLWYQMSQGNLGGRGALGSFLALSSSVTVLELEWREGAPEVRRTEERKSVDHGPRSDNGAMVRHAWMMGDLGGGPHLGDVVDALELSRDLGRWRIRWYSARCITEHPCGDIGPT
ncbi:hypothetical protein VDGL01_08500 [Verticillium dahliae]